MKIPVGLSLLLAVCLASASQVSAQTCGDYARDAGEQCDDGNARNLDGCDAACKFEQSHRINQLQVRGAVDLICPANRFGTAFNAGGLFSTNQGIGTAVQSGATSILLHFLGLDDLTGVDDPSLEVGVLSGAPVLPGSVAYNGSSDTDWWHALDETLVDAQRVPVNKLTGTLAGNALSATGAAEVKLVLGGGPASFSLTGIQLNVTTGAATTPATSTGRPPGHLEGEHLDPSLQSFGTAGTSTPSGFGTMCGNISALSLSQVVVPPTLRATCSEGYTTANHLLDVFISGCSAPFPVGQAVAANTQPDQTVPGAPPAGSGPPYTFTAAPTTKIVTGCQDSSAAPVDLATCLGHAAYSSYFRFTTNRVIALYDLLFKDGFDSGP